MFPLLFPCCSPLSITKREQQTENPPLETPPASMLEVARLGVLSRNCSGGPDAYAGPQEQHQLIMLTSGLMFGNVNFDGAGGNTFWIGN